MTSTIGLLILIGYAGNNPASKTIVAAFIAVACSSAAAGARRTRACKSETNLHKGWQIVKASAAAIKSIFSLGWVLSLSLNNNWNCALTVTFCRVIYEAN